jgi:hypothetical protein
VSATTDSVGHYELQMLNEVYGYDGNGSMDIVFSKGTDYVQLRLSKTVPNIQAIRANYPNLQPDQKVEIKTANGAATVTVETTTTYSGFHVFEDIGVTNLFKLEGEVTGLIALKNNLTDAASRVPPTGSLLALTIGSEYSPYVFWAKTDATGKFVFSASGSVATPDGKANPLPVFANINNAYIYPTLSIQASGGATATANDTSGLTLYTVTLPNMAIYPPLGADKRTTDLGTIYAVADTTARIVSWTPVTFYDGITGSTATNKMSPTVGATTAVTPLTITFSKAIDDTKAPVSGITLQGYVAGATTLPATQMVSGTAYTIVATGTTNFVSYGAVNNAPGTTFVASGAATGTGVVSTFGVAGGIVYTNVAPALAWSTDKLTATITPAYPFAMGDYVTLSISNWTAADGSAVSGVINSTKPVGSSSAGSVVYFAVQDGIKYIGKNSFTDNYGNAVLAPVAGPVKVFFNVLPVQWDTANTGIYSGATAIAGAVTAVTDTTGNYLNFVPTSSLALNTTYTVQWTKVSDGTTIDQTVSGTLSFKTVLGTQFAAPVLSLDSNALAIAKLAAGSTRQTYENGDTVVYLSWPAIASSDQYKLQYRINPATTWNAAAAVITNAAGSATVTAGTWYYAYTLPVGSFPAGLVSGDSIELQLSASIVSANTLDSLYSTLVSVTDGTAPTASAAAFGGIAQSTNNTAGTTTLWRSYTVALAGAEKMSVPMLATGSTLTAAQGLGSVTYTLNQGHTQATILLGVPAGQTAVGQTLVLTLKDAGGNTYATSSTVATQTMTFQ